MKQKGKNPDPTNGEDRCNEVAAKEKKHFDKERYLDIVSTRCSDTGNIYTRHSD